MTRRADHRPSICHRHPTAPPSAGFCPSCLCERLVSVDQSTSTTPTRLAIPDRPHCRDHQLHRSRSYSTAAASRDGISSDVNEPRRMSCGSREHDFRSRRQQECSARELRSGAGDIRICESWNEESAPIAGDFDAGTELRTMREFIELERQNKMQATGKEKECRSFWVLGDKLRKWRGKGKMRNQEGCDIHPAVTSRVSVDYPQNSINKVDDPRTSLDGYLLGRTNRLTPLVSVLKDAKIIHGGLHYWDKPKFSDLDRSTSRKEGAALEVGEVKLKSAAKSRLSVDGSEIFYITKLVITESELMEWNSNSKVAKEANGSSVINTKPELKPETNGVRSSMPVPCAVDCEQQLEKSRRRWSIRGLAWR